MSQVFIPFIAPRLPPGVHDPYIASVVLLFHADGTDLSTTFVDSSSKNHTFVSTDSSVHLSTTSPLFGTASLVCPGNGFATGVASNADFTFGTADFTLELAIKTATPAQATKDLLDFRVSGASLAPTIYINGSAFRYFVSSADQIVGGTVATSTWQRVALSRVSAVTRLFIDGTQVGSNYTDTNNYVQGTMTIGCAFNSAGAFTGNVDELRVTKGVGRYAANYTVATAAFPNG